MARPSRWTRRVRFAEWTAVATSLVVVLVGGCGGGEASRTRPATAPSAPAAAPDGPLPLADFVSDPDWGLVRVDAAALRATPIGAELLAWAAEQLPPALADATHEGWLTASGGPSSREVKLSIVLRTDVARTEPELVARVVRPSATAPCERDGETYRCEDAVQVGRHTIVLTNGPFASAALTAARDRRSTATRTRSTALATMPEGGTASASWIRNDASGALADRRVRGLGLDVRVPDRASARVDVGVGLTAVAIFAYASADDAEHTRRVLEGARDTYGMVARLAGAGALIDGTSLAVDGAALRVTLTLADDDARTLLARLREATR